MLAQADELDELDGAHVDIPLAYYSNLLIQLMAMFGKGAQSTPTSAPESGDGASDHVSTSAGDKISLDDVIAKLRAADNEDKRAQEILAAATTLRDCSGRAPKDALRKMANAWGVTLNEKVGAKYTPRPGSALAEDIQASVCKAALDWESGAARHAKRQKTLSQMFSSGAAGQVGSEHGQAGAPEHGGGEQTEVDEHPATTSTEVFVHDRDEDRVLLD